MPCGKGSDDLASEDSYLLVETEVSKGRRVTRLTYLAQEWF
jgi:hypothetical protein